MVHFRRSENYFDGNTINTLKQNTKLFFLHTVTKHRYKIPIRPSQRSILHAIIRNANIPLVFRDTLITFISHNTNMNQFKLLLIAAAVAVVDSASIRGSELPSQDASQNQQRNLVQESSCTLYQKCVTYLPDADHPQGHHEESWVCELSDDDSSRLGIQFVDVVESPSVKSTIQNATSGESTLTVTEAFVDTDSPRMYIPESAHMKLGNVIETRTEKRILSSKPATTGSLKALVVRVIDNGKEPSLSSNQLESDVFLDTVSLKSQTARCSYNKLQIEPFVGATPSNKQVSNGVVNVHMNYDGNAGLDQTAMQAAKEQLGDLNDPRFDLVMFCFPPNTGNFLAFAYPNSKYSFYSDKWCGFVSAQMHEVGHNLGLGHSGAVDEGAYGDMVGMMGNPGGHDDVHMCYNTQKNYQLGWYEDKTASINPLDGVPTRNIVLNGVSDYKRSNNALVALRLEQTNVEQDFYIGYNRATGINKDTLEDQNKVTVIRKEAGTPHEYSQSTKLKSLSVGQSYTLQNFNNNRDVRITFVSESNGDATIRIQDLSPPKPTTAPTPMPTSIPAPTSAPLPCQSHTVQVLTDQYPRDNSWKILHDNKIVFESPTFDNKKRVYKTKVCLEVGKDYDFAFADSYGDGLLGDSYYRVVNDCTNEQVVTDADTKGKAFTEITKTIETISECIQNLDLEPTPVCKDKKKRVQVPGKTKQKRRSCKALAKRGKCDKTLSTGEYVWQFCQKSCNRCN